MERQAMADVGYPSGWGRQDTIHALVSRDTVAVSRNTQHHFLRCGVSHVLGNPAHLLRAATPVLRVVDEGGRHLGWFQSSLAALAGLSWANRQRLQIGRRCQASAAALAPSSFCQISAAGGWRHRLKVRDYRRNHVASNAVVKMEEQQQMEKILMYRKLVPLICAMLLSTAAFGQGGGGSGGGAGGAAGGGAAGSAGAGGGGTGATGGSTTGTGVNPTAPGSQYTNPTTGLPYSPSNSNDPNNPNSPNNPMSNPRPPGSR